MILEPNLEYRFVTKMAHFVQQHQWFGSYKENFVVWTVGLFGKHLPFVPDGSPSSPSLDPSLPDTMPSLERWLCLASGDPQLPHYPLPLSHTRDISLCLRKPLRHPQIPTPALRKDYP